jgi:hypothetical protein
MVNCNEMRQDEIYMCKECGLELKVVKECRDVGVPAAECRCAPCTLVCCGESLVKKPC